MDNHKLTTRLYHAGDVLVGILLGGLAGAGAMLLLAPQSGKRTRKQIRKRSTELKNQATEAVDATLGQTRDRVHRMSTTTRRTMDRLQHRAQHVLEEQTARVAKAVKAGKRAIQGGA